MWDRNEACPTTLPMKSGHRSTLNVMLAESLVSFATWPAYFIDTYLCFIHKHVLGLLWLKIISSIHSRIATFHAHKMNGKQKSIIDLYLCSSGVMSSNGNKATLFSFWLFMSPTLPARGIVFSYLVNLHVIQRTEWKGTCLFRLNWNS